MSRDIIVITFDTEDKADEVLHSIKSAQKGGFINLEDTVVLRKDADGKVHSRNAMDRTTKEGVAVGGLMGLLLGFMFAGPVGAILVGGIGGGAVGALMGKGVDKKFIKEVSAAIQPNTSALFLVVRSARADVALAVFRQYEGKVIQSSLPEDIEESLERALSSKKTGR